MGNDRCSGSDPRRGWDWIFSLSIRAVANCGNSVNGNPGEKHRRSSIRKSERKSGERILH
jgi:hypothetical protein